MERTRAAFRGIRAAILVTACAAAPAAGQNMGAATDVASVDAIIHALYDVISGPVGQARDWDRFRSLFIPEARLIATGRNAEGKAVYRPMTPDQYVEANGEGLTSVGFQESEIARTTEAFGNVLHAFSTYESRFTRAGQPATARGINSIQLFNDGARWWIVTILWDSERPDNPIPAKYLSGGR